MRFAAIALAALAAASAVPSSAAVTVLASNVDFTTVPFTFGVTAGNTFTLTYDSREQFDPSPVLGSTAGTAQMTAIFGAPSVFFTDPPVTFGPNTFPSYAAIPTDTRISFTLTDSDLGLRYAVGNDFFYGYARFAGGLLESVAFESEANTPILAGAVAAVPEPATWAMLTLGFGAIGGTLRRRARVAVTAA